MSQTDAVVGDLVEVVSILPHHVTAADSAVTMVKINILQLEGSLQQARVQLAQLQESCEHSWCYQAERRTTVRAEQIPDSPWRMYISGCDLQIVCDSCGLQYKRETSNYLCPCCLQRCDMSHVYERFQRRQPIEREPDATLENYLQGRLNALIWRPNGGLWIPYCWDCLLFDFVVEEKPYDH